MAGPNTIQRFPTGLLGWLGMKGGGDTPHELSATIFGSMDIGELYLLDRRRFASGQTAAVSTQAYWQVVSPTTGLLTVPDSKMWAVRSMSMLIGTPLAAGDSIVAQMVYKPLSSATACVLTPPVTAVAGQSMHFGRTFERPFLLTAGDSIQFFVSGGVFGTPRIATIIADYYDFDV
jgi:hypothetical protein